MWFNSATDKVANSPTSNSSTKAKISSSFIEKIGETQGFLTSEINSKLDKSFCFKLKYFVDLDDTLINSTNLNKMVTDDDEFVFCINYLKSQYKYLIMTSCEQTDNSANRVRKHCKVIDEVYKQENGYDGRLWKYIDHKVSLEDSKQLMFINNCCKIKSE